MGITAAIATVARPILRLFGVNDEAPKGSSYTRPPFAQWMMDYTRRPMWRLFYVDMMLRDPQTWFGIQLGDAPLYSAEVEVECKDAEVKAFVEEQWRHFWRSACAKLLKTKRYGFCGFEVVYRYKEATGRIEIEKVVDYHPHDVRPVTLQGKLLGFNLYGGRKPTSTTNTGWTGPIIRIRGPKALWLTYKSEHTSFFGWSLLERAYAPWFDKCMDGGAQDLRRLRNIKDAWVGDRLYVPFSRSIQTPDGQIVSYRDLAREVGENRQSGGVMVFPSERDESGNRLVEYEPPTTTAGETDIMPWIHDLDSDIFDGLLVPAEVVEAATTGSGFSGRSIPMQMFLTTRDAEFGEYVRESATQVFRPLAIANFGRQRADFEMHPKPLLETFGDQQEKKEGGEGGEGSGALNLNSPNGRFSPRFNGAATVPMSPGEMQMAVEDVMQFAIVHAPHNMTIAGKPYKGGQFIPNAELAKASAAEKAEIQRGIQIDKPTKERAKRGELREAQRADEKQVDAKGKVKNIPKLRFATGAEVPAHVPAGKIPAAWRNVRVSDNPDDDVWATGIDGKGRTKTVYSDSYEMRQAAIKFARNMELLKERNAVSEQIQNAIHSADPATREAAACMWLIEEQATRPGSDKDTKSKVKAYGATTLRAEHVVQEDDGVHLKFIGKEGVAHDHVIANAALAKELLRRKRETKDGKLFDTSDTKVLAFSKTLDHGRFTPKDFRTLKATTLAIEHMKSLPKPKDAKEHRAAVLQVAQRVSRVLGNKPLQALESYINPMVFSAWNLAS